MGKVYLKDSHPDLAVQWHPTKNAKTPDLVSYGSSFRAWWVGDCGHEWDMPVKARSNGQNCPYCAGVRVLEGVNDLAFLFPVLAGEWSEHNNCLPNSVTANNNRKVWWKCNKDHEYEAQISHRVNGSGCPYCSGRLPIKGETDLATVNPRLALEWDLTKNSKSSDEVMPNSHSKIWWVGDCGHEWQASVGSRNKGAGCPYCANKKVLKGFNDLAFVHPELAVEWSENNSMSPSEYVYGSNLKVWWKCNKGHEYEATIVSRSKGSGCIICVGKKVDAGVTDLETLFPDIAKEWHPTKNGELLPSGFTSKSGKKVWWKCKQEHEWEATVNDRSNKHGCPYCSGLKVVSGKTDLATKKPTLLKEWDHDTNDVNPSEITAFTNLKVNWICPLGHKWKASVDNRSYGSGCPKCSSAGPSKPEVELGNWVESLNLTIIRSDRSVIKPLELDIHIPDSNIAIEYNGLYWHSEDKKGKNYHYDKWKACKDKGIQLIQVWEDEWLNKPKIVKAMLTTKLGESNQPKVGARKTKIVELDYTTATVFLNSNHIQGGATGSLYLGLEYDSEVVAVVVFKKRSGGVWELVRYATNARVQGGFSKLLKYFESSYEWVEIVTFADLCISDGGLYEGNGFILDRVLSPDYRYVVGGEREHKFGYRLKRFKSDPDLLWVDGLTESQLADLNGLNRIYDAGKQRWVKK